MRMLRKCAINVVMLLALALVLNGTNDDGCVSKEERKITGLCTNKKVTVRVSNQQFSANLTIPNDKMVSKDFDVTATFGECSIPFKVEHTTSGGAIYYDKISYTKSITIKGSSSGLTVSNANIDPKSTGCVPQFTEVDGGYKFDVTWYSTESEENIYLGFTSPVVFLSWETPGLSAGLIAAICVGAVVVFILVAGGIALGIWCYCKRKCPFQKKLKNTVLKRDAKKRPSSKKIKKASKKSAKKKTACMSKGKKKNTGNPYRKPRNLDPTIQWPRLVMPDELSEDASTAKPIEKTRPKTASASTARDSKSASTARSTAHPKNKPAATSESLQEDVTRSRTEVEEMCDENNQMNAIMRDTEERQRKRTPNRKILKPKQLDALRKRIEAGHNKLMGQFGKQLEDSKSRLAETTEATEHAEKSIEAREKELADVNKQIAMKKKRIAQETAEQQKLKQHCDAVRKVLMKCVCTKDMKLAGKLCPSCTTATEGTLSEHTARSDSHHSETRGTTTDGPTTTEKTE